MLQWACPCAGLHWVNVAPVGISGTQFFRSFHVITGVGDSVLWILHIIYNECLEWILFGSVFVDFDNSVPMSNYAVSDRGSGALRTRHHSFPNSWVAITWRFMVIAIINKGHRLCVGIQLPDPYEDPCRHSGGTWCTSLKFLRSLHIGCPRVQKYNVGVVSARTREDQCLWM